MNSHSIYFCREIRKYKQHRSNEPSHLDLRCLTYVFILILLLSRAMELSCRYQLWVMLWSIQASITVKRYRFSAISEHDA